MTCASQQKRAVHLVGIENDGVLLAVVGTASNPTAFGFAA
jgi:hypothetical protein